MCFICGRSPQQLYQPGACLFSLLAHRPWYKLSMGFHDPTMPLLCGICHRPIPPTHLEIKPYHRYLRALPTDEYNMEKVL